MTAAPFPDPRAAPADGPLAIGGDLSSGMLLAAYARGIFPWYDRDDGPILWWSPDPRCVLFPGRMHVSRRLARRIRRGEFEFSFNRAFEAVIDRCAAPRPAHHGDGGGTWITPGMREAYVRLHREGSAHSVEAWRGGELAGGVYGVALNRVFFAESMFTGRTDAGKAALAHLSRVLAERGGALIDCQMPTPHLISLGAVELPRGEFLDHLAANRRDAAARGHPPASPIVPP